MANNADQIVNQNRNAGRIDENEEDLDQEEEGSSEETEAESRQGQRIPRYRQMSRVGDRYVRNTRKDKVLLSGGGKPEKPHIDNIDFIFLIAVSVFFDVICIVVNLIPVVGWIATAILDVAFIGPLFYFLFARKGVTFRGSPVRAITLFIAPLVGAIFGEIPVLGSLEWTAEVLIIAASSRAEDELLIHARLAKLAEKTYKFGQRIAKGGRNN